MCLSRANAAVLYQSVKCWATLIKAVVLRGGRNLRTFISHVRLISKIWSRWWQKTKPIYASQHGSIVVWCSSLSIVQLNSLSSCSSALSDAEVMIRPRQSYESCSSAQILKWIIANISLILINFHFRRIIRSLSRRLSPDNDRMCVIQMHCNLWLNSTVRSEIIELGKQFN